MEYKKFFQLLATDPNAIYTKARGCKRISKLNELQDYYDGKQWNISEGGETRTSRSGKEMWKPFDPKRLNRGLKKGELKTWNLVELMVDVYAHYARGDANDSTKIIVTKDGDNQTEVTDLVMNLFGEELDTFIIDQVTNLSIDSAIANKLTLLTEDTSLSDDLLSKINLTEESSKAIIEPIDLRELEPLYWHGLIRGYVRFYQITKETAIEFGYTLKPGHPKDYYYYQECWFYNDKAEVEFKKYIEDQEIDSGVSNYKTLPYVFVAQNHPKRSFDLDNIARSDVDSLIELQDTVNKVLTDVDLIHGSVAFPFFIIAKEIYNNKDIDLNSVKAAIEKLSLQANDIIFAPLDKLPAEGLSESSISYERGLLERFYHKSGIPKSVFNSEGLSNISTKTMTTLLESLRRKVDAKRTVVGEMLKKIAKSYLINIDKWETGYKIKIQWPNMFSDGKDVISEIISMAVERNIIPKDYAGKKVVAMLGDSEEEDQIIGSLIEEDVQRKNQIERQQLQNELRQEAEKSGQEEIRQTMNDKNRDLKEING